MPRPKRVCRAGEVFHVLNRAVARLTLFEKPEDYDAFVRVQDDQVSDFFRRLTLTHTMRWHAHYQTSGTGHLYQGRFKSFPVQSDEHLLRVMRYVERNPLRAGLCEAAEDWRWGAAWTRRQKSKAVKQWLSAPQDPPLPRQWRAWVNQPQTEAELAAIRHCLRRGAPFGSERWMRSSAARLGLGTTLRPRGRPRKES